MSKILRFIDSLGLSTTAFNIGDRANAHNGDRISPHLDNEIELLNTGWSKVRQTIQVHVPCDSRDLIKLWIYVPKNFESKTAKIEITDQDSIQPILSERTVHTPIYLQDRWLQIKLAQSLAPDTKLRIDFDRVSRDLLARASEYFVYGKSVGGQSSFVGRGYFPLAD